MKRTAAILIGTALLFAGACGSGGDSAIENLPPDEIGHLSTDRLLDIDQFTVSGEMVDDGEEMEVALSYDGEDGHGLLTMGDVELEVLRIGGSSYLRGNEAFWDRELDHVSQAFMETVGDRWIDVTGEPDMEDLTDLADRDAFVDKALELKGEVTAGDTRKIAGVECLELSGGGRLLWVALDDARPIMLGTSGEEGDDLTFGYDDADIPEAPTGDEVARWAS
ncbi:MAG: hypothetical protein QM597_02365 [Aeromicrobium sp.]|uniref:hypothetical protein n=1 Tax=Aeromicrobium sp. TaxID=1871063 RepID=UPI0039E6A792